ncbi:MAG: hypothetical protein SFX73_09880 [Kofleriaceae bacterium]|nr:hypothetical protein [Kofleriaceae bacterium]
MARQRAQPDGRVLRGERNHLAIVDATYALIREGNLAPTAEQIAARSKLAVRTVFRQFAELDRLFADVATRVAREVLPVAPPPPPTGDLAEDLRALVARRARGYEHVAPFLAAARLLRDPPAAWRTQEAAMVRGLRAGLERSLAPYIVRVDASTRAALELLLSFEAWARLRDVQRLSVPDACEAIVHGCRRLLER